MNISLIYIPAVVFFLMFTLLYNLNPSWLKVAWKIWLAMFFIVLNITLYKLITPSDWNTVKVVQGKDQKNASATFKVMMLNDKFTWELGSSESVSLNGEEVDIKDFLRAPEILNEFYASTEIICVGNSSHEGSPQLEEARAQKRGFRFAKWINEILNPGKKQSILVLNLGHNNIKSSNSSSQRRLTVILVIRKDQEVTLKDALKDAISKNQDIFPFDISEYSKFELDLM